MGEDFETCEICGAIIDYVNNRYEECSKCYSPGCEKCLRRGDDIFPYICSNCDGEAQHD